MELQPRYDAVVVGARAAGAATAMLLARAGLQVLVVDRGHEGADTLSTHALMRPGVLQLRRWGLLDRVRASGTPAVHGATYHYGGVAAPVALKPRDGVDALYAPRRTLLDPLLVAAAREAGARVEHRVGAHALLQDARGGVKGVVLTGREGPPVDVEAGIVIGADGLRSRVAAHAHAPVERAGRHASATIYGHWSGLSVEGYQWFWEPGVSAGAVPTNGGGTCVFVAMPQARYLGESSAGLDRLYRAVLAEAAPTLPDALRAARLEAKLHAFPGAPGHLRRAHGRGWALVGDAGHYTDPLSAHGLTAALRDAELLARAVLAGTERALASYQRIRDELSHGVLEVSDRIASFAWDLDQVRAEHLTLARLAASEAELLLGLDRTGATHRVAAVA